MSYAAICSELSRENLFRRFIEADLLLGRVSFVPRRPRFPVNGTPFPQTDLDAALLAAARWHDAGKAHRVFQDALRRGPHAPEIPDALCAKSKNRPSGYAPPEHARLFRHELASALAWLAPFTWAVIVETNRQLCLPRRAAYRRTG